MKPDCFSRISQSGCCGLKISQNCADLAQETNGHTNKVGRSKFGQTAGGILIFEHLPGKSILASYPLVNCLTFCSRSWASVDGRVNFYFSNWGYGELSWWQESQKILSSVVKVNKVLVDVRNPYGQLTSAAIIIEGPISALRPFEEGSRGLRVEPQMHDASSRLFAFHILEENRRKKNVGIQPNIHGLVLASSDLKTYKRIGCYHWKGPVGSRYPAARFERTTITII